MLEITNLTVRLPVGGELRTVLSDVGLQCDLFHQVRRRTRVLAVASANVAPSRGAAAHTRRGYGARSGGSGPAW